MSELSCCSYLVSFVCRVTVSVLMLCIQWLAVCRRRCEGTLSGYSGFRYVLISSGVNALSVSKELCQLVVRCLSPVLLVAETAVRVWCRYCDRGRYLVC